MNKSVKSLFVFVLGAGVGATASALYFKKKYQQEVYEMREAYNKMTQCIFDKPDPVDLAQKYKKEDGLPTDYATVPIAKTYDPPRPLEEDDEEEEEEIDISPEDYGVVPLEDPMFTTGDDREISNYKKPYVIAPEEFGDYPSFSRIDLTMFNDGILCEEMKMVSNIDMKVGIQNLNHFGEYEEDSVYVRNEALRTDFCIIRDDRNYNDIINSDYPKE